MFKEIILSIQAYLDTADFFKQKRMRKWIWIPGIIYCSLLVCSMAYFITNINNFMDFITIKSGLKTWLDQRNSGWLTFMFTLGNLMVWVNLMLLYFSFFKFFFLLVGSPIYAYLSEKTASSIEEVGEEHIGFWLIWGDSRRGISIAARNLIWQTVYMISLSIASVIPFVGWLTPIMAMVIECYYYGFSMLDYSIRRHGKTAQESIFFVSHHKGLAIGNGLVYYCFHLIPFFGWVLAPSYAIVAATFSIDRVKNIQSTVV